MPERLAACEAAEGYPEAPELATLASSLVGLLLGFVWCCWIANILIANS